MEEIEAIGPLLDDAVTQYESGDHDGAADAVGDIYLEHFEKVEGPLGEANHDLMEDLEEAISTDLRKAMEDDAPDEEIESMVAGIKTRPRQGRTGARSGGMTRLAVVASLAVLLALAAGAATARAADGEQLADVRAKVAEASTLVDEAVAAAARGDRDEGYDLAKTAYLDHFELAEVPLRLRNPNLVLDLEFAFAKLRNAIKDGESMGTVRADARDVKDGLQEVDRSLADKGLAAPLVAFVFAFTILFREGVEAVLMIAMLLGSLKAGRAANYRKPLVIGRRPRRSWRRSRRGCSPRS